MTRSARTIAPGIPHHLTRRGNRRQALFFNAGDYVFYRAGPAQLCASAGVETRADGVMPHHIHLILVPPNERVLSSGARRPRIPAPSPPNFRVHGVVRRKLPPVPPTAAWRSTRVARFLAELSRCRGAAPGIAPYLVERTPTR